MTVAGNQRHRMGEMGMVVSCGDSGEGGWRTELDLGSRKSFDDPLMVANRIWDEPWGCRGRRQPSRGGTSRMTGDRLVRICESSRVKFLRSTRRLEQRGRVRRLHQRNNWKQDELDACDKQTVQY